MPEKTKVTQRKKQSIDQRVTDLEELLTTAHEILESRKLEEKLVKDKIALDAGLYIQLAKLCDELDEARNGKRRYIN